MMFKDRYHISQCSFITKSKLSEHSWILNSFTTSSIKQILLFIKLLFYLKKQIHQNLDSQTIKEKKS